MAKVALVVDLDTGKDTLVCEDCLSEIDVLIEMIESKECKGEKCERCSLEFGK